MQTLCTYILTKDTGLAPNPYWGWCTLAVCTPNRQHARVLPGDWIAGFSAKAKGNRLIYAMELAERIHMNVYYDDPRFAAKKPKLRGTWMERCGDNFYSQDTTGSWRQHRNRFHLGTEYLTKDTRNPFVFVATRFWYFGREAVAVPEQLLALVGTRGIRVNHPSDLATEFCGWVASTYPEGLHGLPTENPDGPA